MSDPDNKEPHREKKFTAATTDAPQEEFIRQESVPSEPETKAKAEDKRNPGAK